MVAGCAAVRCFSIAGIGSTLFDTARVAMEEEIIMNDETFNMSIRKFLKMVGVKSQHEIEQAVAKACEGGRLAGNESLPVTMRLSIAGIGLEVSFDGTIDLE